MAQVWSTLVKDFPDWPTTGASWPNWCRGVFHRSWLERRQAWLGMGQPWAIPPGFGPIWAAIGLRPQQSCRSRRLLNANRSRTLTFGRVAVSEERPPLFYSVWGQSGCVLHRWKAEGELPYFVGQGWRVSQTTFGNNVARQNGKCRCCLLSCCNGHHYGTAGPPRNATPSKNGLNATILSKHFLEHGACGVPGWIFTQCSR